MYRSLGTKASIFMYMRDQLRMDVSNQQEPNNTPVLSNVCLICAPVTLLILQDGKLVMCCAWQQ